MGVRRWIIRAYNHRLWIPALSGVAVASLVGTMVLFVMFASDQRDERERSRETDLELCAFSNDLRSDVKAIGNADQDMVQGIVDVVLPADATNGARAEAIRRIRSELDPIFAEHRAAVSAIELIDCDSVVGVAANIPGG